MNSYRVRVMTEDDVEVARSDFARFLGWMGYSREEAHADTRDHRDMVWVQLDPLGCRLSVSQISGVGVFPTHTFEAGQRIGPARVSGRRTQLGRFVNHHPEPNATYRPTPDGDVDLIALRQIEAEEITVDYRVSVSMPGARVRRR